MKKALIIIGAVFAGLILLAIVGSVLPDSEQAVAEKSEVVPPTPVEPVLSVEEQAVYVYIDDSIDDVDKLYDDFADACADFDLDGMVACGREWRDLAEEWGEIPLVRGRVESLEYAYTESLDALNVIMRDAVRIMDGENVSDKTLERHIGRAIDAISACRNELDNVGQLTEATF